MITLLAPIDAFLDRLRVSKRRHRTRHSTLHLLERAHGQILSYHAVLLRSFDAGVRDLAQVVRRAEQHHIDPAQEGARLIERMRQAFLHSARSHYGRAFHLGQSYAGSITGNRLTASQATARISSQENENAHFVDASLMNDLSDRFARAMALVAHRPIVSIAKQDATTEDTQTEEESRRREALLALLMALSVASIEDQGGILDQIDALLGGTMAERDALVGAVADTLSAVDALAVRTAYAGAIMEDFAASQTARIGLYADRLWALVNDGFSSEAATAGYTVDWITTSGDPCDDCLQLESDAPYPPGDLPTVPGGGDTICLSNCKCILELVPPE